MYGGRIALLPFLLLFVALGVSAQFVNQNAPVNVLGQVYAPQGGQLQQAIRVELIADNAIRPPEYVFTDSNGRFVLYGLIPNTGYSLVVQTDGENWATTTTRFMPSGRRPAVTINLLALQHKNAEGKPMVSVMELKSNVPRAARKDYEAAYELMVRGEHAQARPLLEHAIVVYPDFVEARNELSVVLMKLDDLPGAEAQLRRAIEIDPAADMPLMNLGLCLYRQQRHTEAIRYMEKAVQLDPENANAHLLFGMLLMKEEDDKRAEAALLRAYQIGKVRMAKAQLYLSRLYTRNKDYPRAATALEIYLHDNPSDPNAEEFQKTLVKLRAASTTP